MKEKLLLPVPAHLLIQEGKDDNDNRATDARVRLTDRAFE